MMARRCEMFQTVREIGVQRRHHVNRHVKRTPQHMGPGRFGFAKLVERDKSSGAAPHHVWKGA
jgi:hypothetical protein